MTDVKPNIIMSSFARSGATAIDTVIKPILESIGYYTTPFGIEGSHRIMDEIDGTKDPFYHFTHAPPSFFENLPEKPNYKFIYNYRDPRDSIVSWSYNEVSEGNIEGDVDLDQIRQTLIFSKHHLAEHIARAREWLSLGEDRVCRTLFEQTKQDYRGEIERILKFMELDQHVEPGTIEHALKNFGDDYYAGLLGKKEARLTELDLVRKKRGVSGAWQEVFTPVDKLMFKKVAGEYLIEMGYEDDYDW